MLRRRIFSSAMASVMALSSIAVVANAEETVNQYKTEADLKTLVEKTYGTDWRADELPAYGTIATEAVTDALELAESILYSGEATNKDYTYAYFMVEGTLANYEKKTAEDLQKLLDEWKHVYNSDNVYNDELNDLIWEANSMEEFREAYENAQDLVTSTIAADITDAWYALKLEADTLIKLDTVTKAQYRTAMKAYENIISSAIKYDSWRQGTLATGWPALRLGDTFWNISNMLLGGTTRYGYLVDNLLALQAKFVEQYEVIDGVKGLTETSDEDLVKTHKAMLDAVDIFNTWTPDTVNRGTKSAVKSLLKEYHGQLVLETAKADADALVDALEAATWSEAPEIAWNITTGEVYWNADPWASTTELRVESAALEFKAKDTVYIPIDPETGAFDAAGTITVGDAPVGYKSNEWQRIGAGVKFDLTKLITVTIDDTTTFDDTVAATESGEAIAYTAMRVDGGDELEGQISAHFGDLWDGSVPSIYDATGATTVTAADYTLDVADVFTLVGMYLNDDYKKNDTADQAKYDAALAAFQALDVAGAISTTSPKLSGTTAEWTLVYRALYYVLSDRYSCELPGAGATYTRKDVEKLIEDSHVLVNEIGDTAIFAVTHDALVVERQLALEWLRAAKADKSYRDNKTVYDYNGSDMNSTTAYNTLVAKYNALVAERDALAIEFGEIYDAVAEAAEGIDDGTLQPSGELLKAMQKVAYLLSIVDPVTHTTAPGEYYDNEAFNDDDEFIAINRLITTESEVAIGSINGGEKIEAKADGLNQSHYNLKVAYNALLDAVKKAGSASEEVVLGDVDGDGAAYQLGDVKATLALYLTNGYKAEADTDGKDDVITVADAKGILAGYLING